MNQISITELENTIKSVRSYLDLTSDNLATLLYELGLINNPKIRGLKLLNESKDAIEFVKTHNIKVYLMNFKKEDNT